MLTNKKLVEALHEYIKTYGVGYLTVKSTTTPLSLQPIPNYIYSHAEASRLRDPERRVNSTKSIANKDLLEVVTQKRNNYPLKCDTDTSLRTDVEKLGNNRDTLTGEFGGINPAKAVDLETFLRKYFNCPELKLVAGRSCIPDWNPAMYERFPFSLNHRRHNLLLMCNLYTIDGYTPGSRAEASIKYNTSQHSILGPKYFTASDIEIHAPDRESIPKKNGRFKLLVHSTYKTVSDTFLYKLNFKTPSWKSEQEALLRGDANMLLCVDSEVSLLSAEFLDSILGSGQIYSHGCAQTHCLKTMASILSNGHINYEDTKLLDSSAHFHVNPHDNTKTEITHKSTATTSYGTEFKDVEIEIEFFAKIQVCPLNAYESSCNVSHYSYKLSSKNEKFLMAISGSDKPISSLTFEGDTNGIPNALLSNNLPDGLEYCIKKECRSPTLPEVIGKILWSCVCYIPSKIKEAFMGIADAACNIFSSKSHDTESSASPESAKVSSPAAETSNPAEQKTQLPSQAKIDTTVSQGDESPKVSSPAAETSNPDEQKTQLPSQAKIDTTVSQEDVSPKINSPAAETSNPAEHKAQLPSQAKIGTTVSQEDESPKINSPAAETSNPAEQKAQLPSQAKIDTTVSQEDVSPEKDSSPSSQSDNPKAVVIESMKSKRDPTTPPARIHEVITPQEKNVKSSGIHQTSGKAKNCTQQLELSTTNPLVQEKQDSSAEVVKKEKGNSGDKQDADPVSGSVPPQDGPLNTNPLEQVEGAPDAEVVTKEKGNTGDQHDGPVSGSVPPQDGPLNTNPLVQDELAPDAEVVKKEKGNSGDKQDADPVSGSVPPQDGPLNTNPLEQVEGAPDAEVVTKEKGNSGDQHDGPVSGSVPPQDGPLNTNPLVQEELAPDAEVVKEEKGNSGDQHDGPVSGSVPPQDGPLNTNPLVQDELAPDAEVVKKEKGNSGDKQDADPVSGSVPPQDGPLNTNPLEQVEGAPDAVVVENGKENTGEQQHDPESGGVPPQDGPLNTNPLVQDELAPDAEVVKKGEDAEGKDVSAAVQDPEKAQSPPSKTTNVQVQKVQPEKTELAAS